MLSPNTIREYLPLKKAARARLVERVQAGATDPLTVSARVEVAGSSGVRHIAIRDHRLISDSSADYAGYDLGPTSPEIQLGVLGSCLAHTLLIHAAASDVTLDTVAVDVSAELDPRGGIAGFDDAPKQPTNIHYTVHIGSTASPDQLDELVAHVDAVCPVLTLLRTPAAVTGELRVTATLS